MDSSSGGDVTIKQNQSSLDLSKCVICQNVKDKNGDKKLTSTDNGRKALIESSIILQDDLFKNVEVDLIKYHVNTCYSR